ncbi:MAG: MarR family transcriptional regulator [Actinomycetota bacterium]|nr:MarR family transcriptional regulator [Actinomycetota bacterium]
MDHDERIAFERRARTRAREVGAEVDPAVVITVFDLLHLANRLETDFENNVHRPRGFSWAGFRIMFCLWVEGVLEPSRLAHLSGVSRATVSSVCNTLERDGLIVRMPGNGDRRTVEIRLSEAGVESVSAAFVAQERRERAWFAGVERPALESFVHTIRVLLTSDRPALD